jgi:predicted DNA-binding protein (MmcQ/YjbR family)
MSDKRTSSNKRLTKAGDALRKMALAYPEAYEEFPWGHTAVKVKGKAFLFLGHQDGTLGMSVKLPFSGGAALSLPFASPTEYGLGKSGWVSAKFSGDDEVPVDLLGSWIEESYKAIAPKKLIAELAAAEAPQQPARAKRRK